MQFFKIAIIFIIASGIIIYAVSQGPTLKDKLDLFSFKPIKFSPKTPAPSVQEPQEPQKPQESIKEIPDYKIPAGFSREKLSPYFEKVQISSVSFYSYGAGAYPKTLKL